MCIRKRVQFNSKLGKCIYDKINYNSLAEL